MGGNLKENNVRPLPTSRNESEIEQSILWKESPDALISVNTRGVIRGVNSAAERMFQFSRDEMVGEQVELLIPARFHNHAHLRQEYRFSTAKRKPMKTGSFFAHRKDGTEINVDIELTSLKGREGSGESTGVIVWIRDVSERIEYQKHKARIEEEAAGRARSRFLANISHEFRTPLNAILGLQQLILQKGNLESGDHKNLHLAMQSGTQLSELLNNILEIARIESGELDLEERRFKLETLRQSIDNMFRGQADRKGLEYSVRIVGQLPDFVVGDEGKIREILIHLLGNAFKFTSTGEIRATFARNDENELLIEVADTGFGISEDRLVTLFEPFQQVERENTQGEGSGLGLAICKHYITAMNGRIEVDSEEDKGACFRLTLPVLAEEDVVTPAADPVAPEQERLRVLVVDDSESNRNVLGQLLTGVGYDFYEACDGIEAIEMAEACNPQIVLMDLQMPRMDGYDATREIKSRMDTIVVAVSANVFDSDIKKAEEAGVSGFVKKPFRLGMILDEIDKHMDPNSAPEESGDEPEFSLEKLTPEEISNLHQALLRADPFEFKNLISGYDSLDEATSIELLNLLDSYQYDKLLSLLTF
jgi:PAS domain S-box-containing protein